MSSASERGRSRAPAGSALPLQALILAAGQGLRLNGAAGYEGKPKCLLRFGGRTLLERHIGLLRACGVQDICVVIGFQAQRVRDHLERLGAGRVSTIFNPDFVRGSVVSLWRADAAMRAGRDTLLMDADVLYDRRLLERLVASRHRDCLLIDRGFEAGDEPVKVCLRHGHIVEFRKRLAPGLVFDRCGESVGFFRLSAATAALLADRVADYAGGGRETEPHEEALRDLMLDPRRPPFGVEDVTGLPWVEIDFPQDVRAAEEMIMPRLVA
ncbi:MAG: NTP transferase domain-containing protein [Pseudomonadota bacterium]